MVEKEDPYLNFKRLALHAFKLTIPLPDGNKAVFEAPYPKDFMDAINMGKQTI